MTSFYLMIVGGLAIAAGTYLVLTSKRRQFYRRNEAGLEIFENYRSMLFFKTVESVATVFGWILIAAGSVSLVFFGLLV